MVDMKEKLGRSGYERRGAVVYMKVNARGEYEGRDAWWI